MAKPTIVNITHLSKNGITVKTTDSKSFFAHCLIPAGLLSITASSAQMSIYELAEIIAGCFEPNSTFYGVKSVTFTYNNVTTNVSHDELLLNPNSVVTKWENARVSNT